MAEPQDGAAPGNGGWDDADDAAAATRRRQDCERCCRPPRVCICDALPAERLRLQDSPRVIVLQVEAEARRRSAVTRTVPILQALLADMVVLTGRTFGPGAHPLLDEALLPANREATFVLYPSATAVDIGAVTCGGGDEGNVPPCPTTLIFLDGTWEGARRLYQRSPSLHALRTVALPTYTLPGATDAAAGAPPAPPAEAPPIPAPPPPPPPRDDGNDGDDEEEEEVRRWVASPPLFTIRKEPAPLLCKGGRSTAEAVALAVALLPAPTEEEGARRRGLARCVLGAVREANARQVALMDPATVRHRRDRPGYIPNLFARETR